MELFDKKLVDYVICEDALSVVADLGEFDYVLTDPPYSVNPIYSWNKSGLANANQMNASMQRSLVAGVLNAVRKKPDFACWVFTDYKNISYLYNSYVGMNLEKTYCIVWDKQVPFFNKHYHTMHEMILFGSNYSPKYMKDYYGRDLISQKKIHGSKKVHLHDKPPELVEQMCGKCKPGRVLDPFCGGGGLLVGAQRLGWEVVGVDMVPEFVEVANKRLNGVIS